MPSRPLDPDVALSVLLSAICSRNQYTADPGPVLDELIATAGDRQDILAMEAGTWSGFHENDEHMHTLARALWDIPGVTPWITVGRQRRGVRRHAAN